MTQQQMSMFTGHRRPRQDFTWPNLIGQQMKLGFDFETDGLEVYGDHTPVGFGVWHPEVKEYFAWGHASGPYLDRDKCVQWAVDNLCDGTKTIIGANLKFDLAMGRKIGIDFEDRAKTRDVQHMVAMVDSERHRKNLDLIAHQFLGRKKIDPGATPIWQQPSNVIELYCLTDCDLAYNLDFVLMPRLEKEELVGVFEFEQELTWAVIEMEKNGFILDLDKLRQWQDVVRKRYRDAVFALRDLVGFGIDPGKKADKVRLFSKLKIEIEETENGEPSFTMEILEKYSDNPAIRLLMEALELDSFRSKYLDKYAEAVQSDGKIRFSLHQLNADEGGTITGRFSASSPRGIKGFNPQQVFKAKEQKKRKAIGDLIVRSLFIPEDGRDFFSADASQIEYRFFGHYVNDEHITKRYVDDPTTDFHKVLADMIGEDRDLVAKHANFAVLFGAGLPKFAYMINKSEEQAKPIWDKYHRMVPGVRRLQMDASYLAEKRGWVKTILGRKRWFPDKKFHAAINTVCQGSAADYAKLTTLDVYRRRRELDVTMRCVVHDEIVGDCPPCRPEWRIEMLEFLNRQRLKLRVPITWDVKVGRSWNI